MWKHVKWIPLIRGRLSNANPELGNNLFSSVETLYGMPKANKPWQRESPDYKHNKIVVMKIIVV